MTVAPAKAFQFPPTPLELKCFWSERPLANEMESCIVLTFTDITSAPAREHGSIGWGAFDCKGYTGDAALEERLREQAPVFTEPRALAYCRPGTSAK